MTRVSLSFPRILLSLLASAAFVLSLHAPAAAQTTQKVVVMTSYPEEMVSRFETAFEKAHPGTRVEIIWRRSGDAMSYLESHPGHIDVYWTPAQRAFAILAKKGAFRRIPVDMTGLPAKVGGYPISDPDLRYVAAEIAGFGFAINPQRLREKNLPQPAQWTDLTAPQWQDELVFPTPSRVGFAPPLIEILAQGYGWEKGWTLLQQIGSNARPLNQGGPEVSNDVAKGDVSLVVSIDFFIQSAIASGAPIKFIYPGVTGYSPAHIAVFKDAPNPDTAKAFAQYVLSDEGQKILFHSDILKLPVRPATYADKPADYYNPFTAAKVMPFEFDNARALSRQGLNNALFDVMVTDQHRRLREALTTLAEAEQAAGNDLALKAKLEQARKLVTRLPITERQADALAGRFVANFELDATPDANVALLRSWSEQVTQNRQQAIQIAQQVIDARSGKKGVGN